MDFISSELKRKGKHKELLLTELKNICFQFIDRKLYIFNRPTTTTHPHNLTLIQRKKLVVIWLFDLNIRNKSNLSMNFSLFLMMNIYAIKSRDVRSAVCVLSLYLDILCPFTLLVKR